MHMGYVILPYDDLISCTNPH